MIDFFSPVANPEPEALAFVTRSIGAADENLIPVAVEVQHQATYNDELPELSTELVYEITFNGLVPAGRVQEEGIGRVIFSDGDPARNLSRQTPHLSFELAYARFASVVRDHLQDCLVGDRYLIFL